ncbi:hypothetical protein [Microbacterium sp. 13-71-7]|uniref:hypothetical protein n=1 Tax=Microbacterium sp. 13-71-7 TaxID=1970399 RepID=UPI0025E8C5F9|nr:hypothetical protein [Microbacterium sp. 13-71-7]
MPISIAVSTNVFASLPATCAGVYRWMPGGGASSHCEIPKQAPTGTEAQKLGKGSQL